MVFANEKIKSSTKEYDLFIWILCIVTMDTLRFAQTQHLQDDGQHIINNIPVVVDRPELDRTDLRTEAVVEESHIAVAVVVAAASVVAVVVVVRTFRSVVVVVAWRLVHNWVASLVCALVVVVVDHMVAVSVVTGVVQRRWLDYTLVVAVLDQKYCLVA